VSEERTRDVIDYLQHIAEAAAHARSFVEGLEFDAFTSDTRTNYAVVRALEVVGEAAKLVPDAIRVATPEVPWRDMAAMRDKLIHGYADIDLEVVWKTVQEDLPVLAPRIQRVLAELIEAVDGA
jgi:uncharacterized protein with HEPN domain